MPILATAFSTKPPITSKCDCRRCYANLWAMDVKEGDRVTRGQILGRTRATGLAIDDHLHTTCSATASP
jgi:Peptidase family M23